MKNIFVYNTIHEKYVHRASLFYLRR
jgi:hypothetical protein